MFLCLSDGGNKAKELAQVLDACGAEYMFHFSKLSNAGEFGRGDVIVGKVSYRSLRRIIKRNGINAVIDIISVPRSKDSLTALTVTSDLRIPLIKIISPVLMFKPSYAKKFNANYSVNYSYKAIASKINNTMGHAVFFTQPYNAGAIADSVFDMSDLYAPIPSSAEFDVDLALEFGIPIMNVKDFDDFSGVDGIKKVLENTEAKIMITDSSYDAAEKLKAADEMGVEIIFTQNTGYEYEYIFDDYNKFYEFIENTGLLDAPDMLTISNENTSEENVNEELDKNDVLNGE